jgi:hypothetical protein
MAVFLLLLVCLTAGTSAGRQRPDFSGTWTFDQQKTLKPGPDGRIVLAAMLGDEFVALHTATSLTLRIKVQGEIVVAVYDLTGKASRNISPGDIEVTSRASWDGDRLLIDTESDSTEDGKPVVIRTRRVLSIDEAGDLIIERSGTPASAVTPSRSVYRKVR